LRSILPSASFFQPPVSLRIWAHLSPGTRFLNFFPASLNCFLVGLFIDASMLIQLRLFLAPSCKPIILNQHTLKSNAFPYGRIFELPGPQGSPAMNTGMTSPLPGSEMSGPPPCRRGWARVVSGPVSINLRSGGPVQNQFYVLAGDSDQSNLQVYVVALLVGKELQPVKELFARSNRKRRVKDLNRRPIDAIWE
jgi:hypothetical protein